eukprot:1543612-Alexandrium_andersonii.AAC.1
MAALAIRAFLGAQRAMGRSAAVLFLDAREAFYSVNRALAFPADVRTHDVLRRAVFESDLPPRLKAFANEALLEPTALEELGVPPAL